MSNIMFIFAAVSGGSAVLFSIFVHGNLLSFTLCVLLVSVFGLLLIKRKYDRAKYIFGVIWLLQGVAFLMITMLCIVDYSLTFHSF